LFGNLLPTEHEISPGRILRRWKSLTANGLRKAGRFYAEAGDKPTVMEAMARGIRRGDAAACLEFRLMVFEK
jgi:hypothetical protein